MSERDFTERDIHLALDGELPKDERPAYEKWLEANPERKARAARLADDVDLLRAAVAGVAEEPLPERLTAVVKEERASEPPRAVWWRNAAAAAALFVVGALAGYLAGGLPLGGEGEGERLADDAIAAYATYAADPAHAVEVAGGDRDYLQDWLSKRTGLRLVAPDLTAQGFELLGGRILPAGHKAAALLVYRDKAGEQVSIYMMAEGREKARGTYAAGGDGPVAIWWLDQGFGCAIVSSLPEGRRDEVVGSAWRQIKEGLAG
jgi:anti-sigma factor RsiW